MTTTTDLETAARSVADACGVDPFTAVEIAFTPAKPGEACSPWTVRVFVQGTRARVYKQRTVAAAAESLADAVAEVIDRVCEAFRAGDIITPCGIRPQVLASFDERIESIKAARERESLITCVMEMDGVPRAIAERRVDRALAQRSEVAAKP